MRTSVQTLAAALFHTSAGKKFAIIAFWTLFLVGCGPNGCSGSDSAVPPVNPTPAPTTVHRLYVSESGLNRVESLDGTSGKVLATIPVGTKPTMMVYDDHAPGSAVDPKAALWVLDSGSASVTRIDPQTNEAGVTIAIGGSPVDITSAQNGSDLLYVADGQSNSIAIVNEDDNSIIGHITTAGRPFQISANASVLMVGETNNTVEVFDDTKPSIAPLTSITTQSALTGVDTDYTTDPTIETADGILHIYSAAKGGGLPWTSQLNYTLPHGAGQLAKVCCNVFMVTNASSKLVQYVGYIEGETPFENDLATGVQPGFGTIGGVGTTGYIYIPNTGGDSLSVYYGNRQPYGSWPLTAGARPVDTLTLEFEQAASPTPAPTATPTAAPTATPTVAPTATPTVAPTATPTVAPTATPTAAPTSTPAATRHLYVANGSGGNVLEYTSPFSASSAPSVNLNIGGNIWGVASDSSYVAIEDSNGYIYIFAQPLSASASPVAQFQSTTQGAQLLFDSSGNLYTGTEGRGVLEYSPPFSNSSTPSKTIFGDAASFSLTMDYSNNLYVGNLGMNQIDIFASPYTGSPTSVPQPGTYGLASYATYLYGADANGRAIDVYNLPMSASSTPAFTISNTDPHGLAADVSTGTLYVGDQHGGGGSGSIDVYSQPLSGSSTSAYSITSGVREPVQVWIGP